MEKLPLNQFTRMSIDDAGGKRKGVLCPENLVKKIAMVICALCACACGRQVTTCRRDD
jgi:hypothetical protein